MTEVRQLQDPGLLAVVRVLDSGGTPVGAGVLVGRRHVVTVAHNVAGDSAEIDFPLSDAVVRLHTEVVLRDPEADLCGLRLLDDPPAGVMPAPLVLDAVAANTAVQLYGVPDRRDAGFWIEAQTRGPTAGGLLQLDVARDSGIGVLPGYSGGPVWSAAHGAAIGIVRSAEKALGWRSAYALPMAKVFELWPELHEAARPPSPYRGLGWFRESDRSNFHGRASEAYRLHIKVRAQPVTLVVANPGLGKSSLVRAGVVPLLREQGHQIAFLDTGAANLSAGVRVANALGKLSDELVDPDQLPRAIARLTASAPLVLIIDQLEELLVQDPAGLTELFDKLRPHAATQFSGAYQLRLLCCMRLDFLARASAYLPPEIIEAPFNLSPLTEDGLRDAIARPAESTGHIRFTQDTVNRIVQDARDATTGSPGELLPMIEFTVTKLWNEAATTRITPEDYHRIGGVSGALVRTADEVINLLEPAAQRRAPRLLTRLVRVGDDSTQDTRATVLADELTVTDMSVVQRLASKRLVVIGEIGGGRLSVRLTHDALLTRWDRLRGWIEEDRQFRRWQAELLPQRMRWAGTNDTGALLRGGTLRTALSWLVERDADVDQPERDFIEASRDLARRDRRKVMRQRTFLVGFGLLTVLVMLVATVLVPQLRNSMADSLLETGRSLDNQDDSSAIVVNAAAQRIRSRSDTTRMLLDTLLDNQRTIALLPTNSVVRKLAIAGPLVLVLEEHRLLVWDTNPAKVVHDMPGITGMAVTLDGTRIAIGDDNGRIEIRDAVSWNVLTTLEGPDSTDRRTRMVGAMSFDTMGSKLATAARESNRVRLWDLDTGEFRDRVLDPQPQPIDEIGFTTAGSVVAATPNYMYFRGIWDTRTDEVHEIQRDPMHWTSDLIMMGPRSLQLTCDGTRLTATEPDTRRSVSGFDLPQQTCLDTVVALAGDRIMYYGDELAGEPAKLTVFDDRGQWARLPAAAKATDARYTISSSSSLIAWARGNTVRVVQLPERSQDNSGDIAAAQFLSDHSLVAFRRDGVLRRFAPDGAVATERRLPCDVYCEMSVSRDESRVSVIARSDEDRQNRLSRFTLPGLEPIGPPVAVNPPRQQDSATLGVTLLDDGRTVVRARDHLLIYPDSGPPRIITLAGADDGTESVVTARPGTSQVAVPVPGGGGVQLIDIDRAEPGRSFGSLPGGQTEAILFDGPDKAVVLTSTTAVQINPETGELGGSRPVLAEVLRRGADARNILQGWPDALERWGFAPDSERIWPSGRDKLVLSPDGDRMAVLHDLQLTILSTDPAEWRESLCATASATLQRARAHLDPPWLLNPC